uniref:Endo/exonuclease/phosphatase domain-containing protein n=1 Tax=Steinernema glaseri TaxID=37863 RepID=A0A1I8ABV9_9BILA
IDVLAVTELRWKGTGAMDLNDSQFRFYYAGPDGNTAPPGTGFIVSRRIQSKIVKFQRIGPRISTLDVDTGSRTLRLFSVYAPASSTRNGEDDDRNDEEFEGLLETLGQELDRAPYPIILGDLNAKMG